MKRFFNLNILIIAGLGLFLWLIVYLLISAKNIEADSALADKKVEINNAVLRGYKDGKMLWSMQSLYIWSTMTIDHAVAENIYNGKFYDQERLLLDDLSARRVQANAPQERFFADRGFRSVMYRNYAADQPVDVWGEQLNYNAADKRSVLNKKIQVTDRNTVITAERASIDHSANQISFGRDALLMRPDSSLTAEELLIDINKDIFTARKNVQLIRHPEADTEDEFKKQKTEVYADCLEADVSTDLARLTLSNNILIQQPDKQAVGDSARFAEIDHLFYLQGNASVVFDKTEVLLDVPTREKLKNREILQEKLQMQADTIIINTDTKDLYAENKVQVIVKNKQATAQKADYKRQEEKIYLYNNVLLKQEDGSLVSAEKVIVDIATEKFTAAGQAESTFYLKR